MIEYRAVKGSNPIIFNDFSLDIYEGQQTALIGSNGAGKTTLLKLMTGLIKPKSGDVFIGDQSTKGRSPENISDTVSLVYQNPEEMFIRDSIREDIEFAMRERKINDYKEKADRLINMFNLQDIRERDGRLLSGGQMRRASLAIGIALNPEILLLDEPTANLDISTRKEIRKVLEGLNNVVTTTVIATHDMQLVSEWAQRIIVLHNGKILADGTREEIFLNKYVVEQSGIRPPEIYLMSKELDPAADCFTVREFLEYFGGESWKGKVYGEIKQ